MTEQVLWLDLVGYLPDDILTKLDRAAMACSLETRVPFLDRQVLDLAWRLPMAAKLDGAVTKRVLRTVLHRHVPAALVDRPKMGFGVPIGSWLRGPLAALGRGVARRRPSGRPGSARSRSRPVGLGRPPERPARPRVRVVGRAHARVLARPLDAGGPRSGCSVNSGERDPKRETEARRAS